MVLQAGGAGGGAGRCLGEKLSRSGSLVAAGEICTGLTGKLDQNVIRRSNDGWDCLEPGATIQSAETDGN